MNDKISSFPKIVRAVPDPLGLYLRLGHNDHRSLSNLLASGVSSFSGAIFDPTKLERQSEVRDQVLASNLDVILDPRTLKSSMLGGFTSAMGQLPWGVGRPHVREDFEGVSCRIIASQIAAFACDHGFTQVMVPSHYIESPNDSWLSIDIESAYRLRLALDSRGGSNIPLIYPLAIPYKLLRNKEQRYQLVRELSKLHVNSIWLTISGAGRNSTATAARNHIEASRDLHSLKVPIVADHMGGAFGLSLMAFGATGGIAHGFMQNEGFNINPLKRPPKRGGFGSARRIYVPAIDAMLSEKEAETLFSSRRAKAHFACSDSTCCPRGVRDMSDNHMRHFLYQRIQEVAGLSRMPETLRPQRFLDQHLRPATDKALAATQVEWGDEKTEAKMLKNRKHLDNLRIALGDYAEKNPPRSFSLHPKIRVARSG